VYLYLLALKSLWCAKILILIFYGGFMLRIFPILIVVLALALPRAGSYLVVDRPSPSDAIVVLAGDPVDTRVPRGLQALKTGFGRELLIDADDQSRLFGKTVAQLAETYIQTLPTEQAAHIHVCPLSARSTFAESAEVAQCLAPLHPRRVLIVTSDYHTRRALSIFQRRLPQYEWSTAAAYDTRDFRQDYWNNRQWLKTTLLEWQRLIYWELVERWKRPVASGGRLAASARSPSVTVFSISNATGHRAPGGNVAVSGSRASPHRAFATPV
jgi:uncharacterized SAM-binding protein YcdF (DUF218 family)